MMKWLVTQVNKKNKGFTLIEMVVVMAIIAVLIAIAVPQVLRLINKSKVTADLSSAKAIATQIQQYMADGGNVNLNDASISSDNNLKSYVEQRINGGIPKIRFNSNWEWRVTANTTSEEVYVGVNTGANNATTWWLFPEVSPQQDSNPYWKYK
ncbi:hypothetical protein Calow_1599 [Caldicellulosiruptor owensensis OL]|uniref:Prepilin-type N-terminal cleavage/methylation domain-containing protein n=1 Tax=Caldicellulosiruptor owensensis (strain ATCC 700167 / DSM 13100 / OL) TaxID=632518 RepID=E4Q3R5_CALOW|nr:type II secretion system protein [Caldicellulosiruptor owensensis]ADQ05145.1 hypothetical protein Calow_1599 [Caldicellulosiruptor owensensis OL]